MVGKSSTDLPGWG